MSAAAKSLNLFHRRKSRQQIPTSADAPSGTPADSSTSNVPQPAAVPTSISREAHRNILKSFLEKRKRRKGGSKENSKQQAFALEGENDNGDYEYQLDQDRLETRWNTRPTVSQIEGNGISDYRTDGSCMQCGDSVPAFMLEERILEVDGLTVGICLECYPAFLQFLEDSAGDEEAATAIDRANWSWGVPRRSSTRRSSAPDRFATLGMTLTVANPSEDDDSDEDDVPAQRPPNHQRTRSEIHSRATTHTRSVPGAGAAQECTICNDTHPNHDFVPATTSCSHSITYCRTCLSTWITSSLNSYGWNAIRCPADNCKQPLSATDIHLHADKPTLEAYTAAATKSTLSALPNFQWCLSPSCSSGQFHDSQEDDGPIFTCHACGFRSCVVHAVPWHDGETCEQYSYRTDKSLKRREEVASMATVAQTTRRCPKRTGGCGAPIEKNEGCDHMNCRKCGFEFCWICGAAHGPIVEFGNSRHEVWCKQWRRG